MPEWKVLDDESPKGGSWKVLDEPQAPKKTGLTQDQLMKQIDIKRGRVKPGMTDDEIITALGEDPAVIKKSSDYHEGMFSQGVSNPNGFIAKYLGKTPLGGFAGGFMQMSKGAKSLLTDIGSKIGIQSQEDARLAKLSKKFAAEDYEQNWKGNQPQERRFTPTSAISEWAGENVPLMALPAGKLAGTTGKALIKQGLKSAAAGALAQGISEGEANPTHMALAGTIGTGAQAALELGVVPLASRVVSFLKGRGVPSQNLAQVSKTLEDAGYKSVEEMNLAAAMGDKKAQALETQFKLASHNEFGVPAAYPDLVRESGPKLRGAALDKKAAMLALREQQLQKGSQAARELSEKYSNQMNAQAFEGESAIKQAASAGNRKASRVVDAMRNAGDDPNAVMRASLMAKEYNNSNTVGKLFDKLDNKMKLTGDVNIEPTVQMLKDKLATEGTELIPNEDVSKELSKQLMFLTDSNRSRDWSSVRKAVSKLGEMASDYGSSPDPSQRAAARVIGDVRKSLRNAMDEHVMATGDASAIRQLNEANKAYQKKVLPFRDPETGIPNITDATYVDTAVKKLVQRDSTGFDQTANIYNHMDQKGQAAFRSKLIAEALDQATKDNGGKFSPAQFSSYLNERGKRIGLSFEGQEKWKVEALANLMTGMKRAREAIAPSTTGLGLRSMLESSGKTGAGVYAATRLAQGHPGEAMIAASAMAYPILRDSITQKLYTTPEGIRFLLTSSKMTPGSEAFNRYVSRNLPKALGPTWNKIQSYMKSNPIPENSDNEVSQ